MTDPTATATRRRIIVTVPAANHAFPVRRPASLPAAPACEDCGADLSAADIRDYRREANMGAGFRGIPRCCAACAGGR